MELVAESTGRRLARHIDALPVHVELPAVVDAAETTLCVAAEEEGGATVRAVYVDEADAALAVAEGHEVLAEEADAERRAVGLRNFGGEAGRCPVAAEEVAHRCPGADLGDHRIVFFAQHVVVLLQ